jgi:hypothetical protein
LDEYILQGYGALAAGVKQCLPRKNTAILLKHGEIHDAASRPVDERIFTPASVKQRADLVFSPA